MRIFLSFQYASRAVGLRAIGAVRAKLWKMREVPDKMLLPITVAACWRKSGKKGRQFLIAETSLKHSWNTKTIQ